MIDQDKNKLILGTAQFGSSYGIKQDGQPSEKELEKIARVAWDGGIRVIHTSWQYNLLKIYEAIFDQFEKIEKNKENPDWFHWGIQGQGRSFYKPLEYDAPYRISMIPVNILDNRFKNIWMNKNGLIIARSVFLQGLLLMDDIPDWVSIRAFTMIAIFQNQCVRRNIEYYEGALGYVLGLDEIDYVIVGVNNAEQLKQLLEVKPLKWDYDFSITDENVLDPRRWPNTL